MDRRRARLLARTGRRASQSAPAVPGGNCCCRDDNTSVARVGATGPDYAVTAIVQWQHRQGAGLCEAFVGRSVMRPIGGDIGYDRDLVVVLNIGFDAGRSPDDGVRAIRRNDQAR